MAGPGERHSRKLARDPGADQEARPLLFRRDVFMIVTLCSAVISISSALAVLISFFKVGKKYVEGQRCLLRTVIKSTYYEHREDKQIPEHDLENFVLCYEAYKALGGNSFVDILYKEVSSWDVVKSDL